MVEILITGHTQVPRRDYWIPYIGKMNHSGTVLDQNQVRNAITQTSAGLLIYEFDVGIFEKDSSCFINGLASLGITAKLAQGRGLPILVVTDKSVFKSDAAQEKFRQEAQYVVEQPLERSEMENAITQTLEMKVDKNYKPAILAQNYTDGFFKEVQDEARKVSGRITLRLEAGKTYNVKNFNVNYVSTGFGTMTMDWLKFTPASRTYLSAVSLMLRNLRNKHDAGRMDGKRTSFELAK